MKKITHRNCSLASHLTGNRGAGQHSTAHSQYLACKQGPDSDLDALTEEEMCNKIVEIIKARVSVGIDKHFISNFLMLGSRADVKQCLDLLAMNGEITAFDNYVCLGCASAYDVKRYDDSSHRPQCCDGSKGTRVVEFYSA
jgi:hypothetical protein